MDGPWEAFMADPTTSRLRFLEARAISPGFFETAVNKNAANLLLF